MTPARIRLFVAVHPPPEVAVALLEAATRMALPPCRHTPAAQVHLTLQFIGERPVAELDDIRESVRRSVSGLAPFMLRPRRIIALPERPPARLVAAEIDDEPTLAEAKRRLVTRLAHKPSRRPFRPHMTLARFRTPTPFSNEQPLPEAAALEFGVDGVALMRSALRPGGAVHEFVERTAFA